QPAYSNSSPPPGASTTPSSETNSVAMIFPIGRLFSESLLVLIQATNGGSVDRQASLVLSPRSYRGLVVARHEETQIDPRSGRYVNAELAEYLLPVNADVGVIDVSFVTENDPIVSAIGAKGVGEIGITGVAASIAQRRVS